MTAPLKVLIEAEMKPFTAAMAQVRQEAAAAGSASAAAFTAAEERIRRLPGGLAG